MKTRKELIVELVAGLGSLKNTAGKITHASELLADKIRRAWFDRARAAIAKAEGEA